MNIVSPVTKSNNILLEKELDTALIIERYKRIFNVDVSQYFRNLDRIGIYRCLNTGYRFYYPFDLGGDSLFDEQLQKVVKLYYLPWKWEHQQASKYVHPGMKVLEVGCGKGDFINKISGWGAICTGLELNGNALKEAQKKGLNIFKETIQQHSANHSEYYDIVFLFQVLEHISDVRPFIESIISVLKRGGKLIISVPNNDSTLDFENMLLNLPPHHMGLWNRESLTYLGMIFKLKLIDIKLEPLQEIHYKRYKKSIEKKFSNNNHYRYKILRFLFFNLRLKGLYFKYIKFFSKMIKGHTIMAVYYK
jgi:2-polyprenyl-3-methyl-5-hydroxy-6-metoxy-1,4-benzoquinol methylase